MIQDLQTILGFTDADLEANRDGKITEHQCTNLKKSDSYETQNLIFGLGLIFVIVIPFCGVCALLFNIPAIMSSLSSIMIGIIVATVVLIAVLVIYANWRGNQERAKMPDVVSTDDQRLDFQQKKKGSHEVYSVIAGDQTFKVDYEIYTGLQAHQRTKPENFIYRIYHTPHNPYILSIELINIGAELS